MQLTKQQEHLKNHIGTLESVMNWAIEDYNDALAMCVDHVFVKDDMGDGEHCAICLIEKNHEKSGTNIS